MSKSIRICGNSVPSEVFEWLAKGEQVQVNIDTWTTCSTEGILRHLLTGTSLQFRLKPRTVKIGGREVEAPVLEPGDRRMVWCWDSDFNKPEEQHADGGVAEPQFKMGLCFATEEACRAAHDAFHALLRGEA